MSRMRRCHGKRGRDCRGFSLIEIIAVLLLVGVLGAVGFSRLTPTADYSLAGETETLKGHLRYAQLRALNDTVPWRIVLTAGGYTLYRGNTGTTQPSTLPGENSGQHAFTGGVSLASGSNEVVLDNWGSPGTANISFILSNGAASRTISITAGTGFIP